MKLPILFSSSPIPRMLLLAAAPWVWLAAPAAAQDTIFRCGNEYINDAAVAKKRGCKTMEGGNITVIQGTKPQATRSDNAPAAPKAPSTAARSSNGNSGSGSRIDTADQRSRDSDARAILQAEFKKAQDRLEQAKKAYANGEPEKEGVESRNHQRYLDRVAELKAAKERAESDVNSISRELGRFGPAKTASNDAQ